MVQALQGINGVISNGLQTPLSLMLGQGVILPEMVAAKIGREYVAKQLALLAASRATAEKLVGEGYVLVPRPPIDLTTHAIYCRCEEGRFGVTVRYREYTYMDEICCSSGSWLALREAVPVATRGRTMAEQRTCLQSAEYVPNVAEVAWVLAVCKLVLGQTLYNGIYARTTTEYTKGCPVAVGTQDGNLSFLPGWGGERLANCGLAVALEL